MDQPLKDVLLNRYGGSFVDALVRTLDFEGGLSNHASDRGGKTKYGVTQATLDAYNKHTGHHPDLGLPPAKVADLTIERAADVYHVLFWTGMRVQLLPPVVRGFMFDWGVHAGFFAIRSMQRHLKLKPDGVVGPRTRAALDDALMVRGERGIVRALAIRRMKHLCRLVRRDRKQGDFIVGWFDRVSYWLH
jgi:lysozyme family protein